MPTFARIGVLVVSLWALGCGGSSSEGDPVDGAVAIDASAADAPPDDTTPDAAGPSTPDAPDTPGTPDAATGTADAGTGSDGGTGPCSVEPTGQTCRDCVTNVGRACLGPCADEGAAVLACGALNGCCQGTNCEPACMQRECMPQLQAVFDCAVDACDEEIRVCF